MYEQNVSYQYNGISFSNKEEHSTNTCFISSFQNWKHYAKWEKPDTEDHTLSDSMYMKSLE